MDEGDQKVPKLEAPCFFFDSGVFSGPPHGVQKPPQKMDTQWEPFQQK